MMPPGAPACTRKGLTLPEAAPPVRSKDQELTAVSPVVVCTSGKISALPIESPILVRPPKPAQRAGKTEELVPDHTLYRITLAQDGGDYPLTRVMRGNVILHGESSSIVTRVWRNVLGVLIRESGA